MKNKGVQSLIHDYKILKSLKIESIFVTQWAIIFDLLCSHLRSEKI